MLSAQGKKEYASWTEHNGNVTSSDTLLNDFFSQDDLKQLAVDAGIMLECPLLVLDDTFHVVAYYYPPVCG